MTIILFPDSLPKRGINISSFLRARCHFLCFLFARGWCWVRAGEGSQHIRCQDKQGAAELEIKPPRDTGLMLFAWLSLFSLQSLCLQRRVLQVPTFRALYRKAFFLSFHQILSQAALQQLVKGREAFYYSDSLKAATPWKMQDSYRCWEVFLLSPFLACVFQFNTSSQPWFSMIIVNIVPFECKKMHLLVCLEAEPGNIVSHLVTL